MKASELIADPAAFCIGTLYRNADGKPCGPDKNPVAFDCLGALLHTYPNEVKREPLAKEVFATCLARHGHKRLGKLSHDEAVDLLRSCNC